MKRKLGAMFFMILLCPLVVHAQSPREQLNQLVTQLVANPSDTALRERLIKFAQQIKPAPAVPEEARAHFVEGTAIAKSARSPAQQTLAVQSFQEALKIAPWWGDAYYNLAVAQELAGQFDTAQTSFKLYILTNPGAKDAREAQDRIYALNAKKKMAMADQNSPETIAERERKFLQSLEGAVWVSTIYSYPGMCLDYACSKTGVKHGRAGFLARNGQLLLMSGVGWWPGEAEPSLESGGITQSFTLTGKRMSVIFNSVRDPSCNPVVLQITDDGNLLTETSSCYGRTGTHEYTRKR